MNSATLAAGYLRARPLQTALSLVLLALGVATIVLLLLAVDQIEERMGREARGIDLVVGAKGSPLQLILAGIYHLDAPTGNIPLAAVQSLAQNRMVKSVLPLALGDSLRGYRIVGATHDYVAHYRGRLAAGALWAKPMEAVLGAEVAARLGLGVGAQVVGAHGISGEGDAHGELPYTVVGVLAPGAGVLDRLVLTSIESVWHVHEAQHEPEDEADRKALEGDREVTVLLVQYASPLAAAMLPRMVNAQSTLQAASPALETARLFRLVGVGIEALRAFALVLILAAGFSVFIALTSALEERRYDLAVMRTLGASPARLFGLLVTESLLLSALGAGLGLVLGHGLTSALGAWLEAGGQYGVTGLAWRHEEIAVAAVALGVGLVAALLPGWRAYHADVARILAQE